MRFMRPEMTPSFFSLELLGKKKKKKVKLRKSAAFLCSCEAFSTRKPKLMCICKRGLLRKAGEGVEHVLLCFCVSTEDTTAPPSLWGVAVLTLKLFRRCSSLCRVVGRSHSLPSPPTDTVNMVFMQLKSRGK